MEILLVLMACGGQEMPSDSALPDSADTADTADTGSPQDSGVESPVFSPRSNDCVERGASSCLRLEADGWSGGQTAVVEDDGSSPSLLSVNGQALTSLQGTPLHAYPSGLTAMPDGGWALGLSGFVTSVTVGSDTYAVETGKTYNRILLVLDAEGALVRGTAFQGASKEDTFVTAQPDGTLWVHGPSYVDLELGGHPVRRSSWVYSYLVAAWTAQGEWAWARSNPSWDRSSGQPVGDAEIVELRAHDQGAEVSMLTRGELVLDGLTLSCPAEADRCAHEVSLDASGTWGGAQ